MSTPSSANVYTQGFGSKPILGKIVTNVNPGTTYSPGWQVGQEWVNTAANTVYFLTSISTSGGVTTPIWTLLEAGGEGGSYSTLTSTGATTLATTGANTNTFGNTTGATSVGILAGSGGINLTGAVTSANGITVTAGNITATNGNLVVGTAGNKLLIKATNSATCSAGQFTLGGTATTVVSNSAVTAASLIFLTTATLGTVSAASTLAVTAQSAGTSFTVTPSQSTDTSVVNYLIIN